MGKYLYTMIKKISVQVWFYSIIGNTFLSYIRDEGSIPSSSTGIKI